MDIICHLPLFVKRFLLFPRKFNDCSQYGKCATIGSGDVNEIEQAF